MLNRTELESNETSLIALFGDFTTIMSPDMIIR